MGTFRATLEIAARHEGPWARVEAVLEPRSTYAVLGRSLLRSLGVEPHERRTFIRPDGSVEERDIGTLSIRLDGHPSPCVVVFGDVDGPLLLGVVTLSELGVRVDGSGQGLVEDTHYLLTLTEAA